MIKIITGNLLKAEEDIIVHQVNCQKRMGSGIALQVKEQFPSAYRDYMSVVNPQLGMVYVSAIPEHKYIAHLFAQDRYGYDGKRYTNYEALFTGLEHISLLAKRWNKSVAIPYKIGSDRGGANWEIVLKMIEVLFKDVETTIYQFGGN